MHAKVALALLLLCALAVEPAEAYRRSSKQHVRARGTPTPTASPAAALTVPQDKAYRSKEAECRRTDECKSIDDSDGKELCVRKCQSEPCWAEFWRDYELEEGEVDTRQQQFKGCVIRQQREKEEGMDPKLS